MKEREYLDQPIVKEFMRWVSQRINNIGSFEHNYWIRKTKQDWYCKSIFNAYEKYSWRFHCIMPNGIRLSGSSYLESKLVLDELSGILNDSIRKGNEKMLKDASISVLSWGGVKRYNVIQIENHENYLQHIVETIDRLNPRTVSLGDNFNGIVLNSGFTKIYSLLINDFIIYDGRVGAALGYLVRLFLESRLDGNLPDALHFYYGVEYGATSAISRRDPSSLQYRFKRLTNSSHNHINNNVRANWVAKHLSNRSRFSELDNPIRALESALFMIGYDISENRAG